MILGVLLIVAGRSVGEALPGATNWYYFWGNLLLLFVLLAILNVFVLDKTIHSFQNRALPWIMSHYEDLLRWSLHGWRPVKILMGTIALLLFSFAFFSS